MVRAKAFGVFCFGAACLVAALWVGMSERAGCWALGMVGVLLMVVSGLAFVPDRPVR